MAAGDEAWGTRIFAAELCGMGDRNFDAVVRPRLPDGAVKGAGKSLRFHLPQVVAALVAYRLEQAAPAAGGAETDPMLAGGDSPNLERYRGAKADLAEMDLQERRGTHANLAQLDGALLRFAGSVRRSGEVLQRRFGNEASDILNEGIDGAVAAYRAERERVDDDGGGSSDGVGGNGPGDPASGRRGAGPAAAKPPRVR